jgi:glycerol-3-phosphate dehydrogenase subunit C
MTTTYDPFHPQYFVEADLRDEMVRVYDLCHGCRLCFKFCSSFPSMFEAIDQHDDQDAARMTVAEQDKVVDECFNCKLCHVNCPYIPGRSDWQLDFPRLMLRAKAVANRNGDKTIAQKVTDQALGRTDLSGMVSTKVSGVVNKVLETPGTKARGLLEKVTGISAQRVLPPFARTRFSTWFRKRLAPAPAKKQGDVTLFPTCLVEYQAPGVGKDVVRVLERNGVACSLPEGLQCCGAPWLHEGDVEHFRSQGGKNVEILAKSIREKQAAGLDPTIVVPQPTCGYVLKKDYPDYLGGPDAALVAEHTMDAAEYLWSLHKGEGTELDVEFSGKTYETITYHAPCHLRAQNIGLKGRDVMKLTGAKITLAAECSGIDGMWGYRAENVEMSKKVAKKLHAAIEKADSDIVAGECHLANGGIAEGTGQVPQHPLSVLARAYGIPQEN